MSLSPFPFTTDLASTSSEGPIISFRLYNRLVVVLNDHKSVHELLNRRADNYSDRPKSWMYHELCGRGKSVFNISSLDARHRRYRKILHSGLSPTATKNEYVELLERNALTLVNGFMESPNEFEKHIRRWGPSILP